MAGSIAVDLHSLFMKFSFRNSCDDVQKLYHHWTSKCISNLITRMIFSASSAEKDNQNKLDWGNADFQWKCSSQRKCYRTKFNEVNFVRFILACCWQEISHQKKIVEHHIWILCHVSETSLLKKLSQKSSRCRLWGFGRITSHLV